MAEARKIKEEGNMVKMLASLASREFSDTLDFVWKSPRFLRDERGREMRKAIKYFPGDIRMSLLRWRHHKHRLNNVFPYLVATGNLFCVMSLFEVYMLRLARTLEEIVGKELKEASGQGVQRVLNFLRDCGIRTNEISLWPQIDAALKIRNCLAHADGLLQWSRDEQEIRRIARSGTFLKYQERAKKRTPQGEFYDVMIVSSDVGDRITISPLYAWLVTYYCRDYFIELCSMADNIENAASEK